MDIKKHITIVMLFCCFSSLFCWSWPVSRSSSVYEQDVFSSAFGPRIRNGYDFH